MKQSYLIGGIAGVVVIVAGLLLWQSNQTPSSNQPDAIVETMDTEATLARLVDSVWIWEQTIMNDGEIIEPSTLGGFLVTFAADGTVSGQTDCNGFSGGFTLDGTTITAGPFAMTMMYCEGSSDVAFANMIEQAQSVFFTTDENLVLLLPFDSGSVVFSRAEQ